MLPVGKVLEHSHAVITDGGQPQALIADIADTLFQLDELGFAKRSPVCRPEKYQQCPFRTKDTPQVLQLAVLIWRLKCRDGGADIRARFDCLLRPYRGAGEEANERGQQSHAQACAL